MDSIKQDRIDEFSELSCDELCYLESKKDSTEILEDLEETRRNKNCQSCNIKNGGNNFE
ncbi:hypothetical protein JXM83_02935 [Candidatus Woesearchaeota archaeon]|nr:hypothetical protein [Candidatus Woesearchaeota archaeon]